MHLMCLIISCLFFNSPALLVPLFTYDSSHPPPLRTLFHTIPCLFHSSSPSFFVRFLSSSASSYAFPHHSLSPPLSLPILLRTIPLILCFLVRFSTPFPAPTTLPVHLFTYDSSHPLLLRTLFHTIPCPYHSSSPSFYVRFLSSMISSYALSTSHQRF